MLDRFTETKNKRPAKSEKVVFDDKLVKELIIRKKKLEKELNDVKNAINKLIEKIPPGRYGDILVIASSRMDLDVQRLKEKRPKTYYKFLKEIKFKYAKLVESKNKGGKK